jgi:hypothetical protein
MGVGDWSEVINHSQLATEMILQLMAQTGY